MERADKGLAVRRGVAAATPTFGESIAVQLRAATPCQRQARTAMDDGCVLNIVCCGSHPPRQLHGLQDLAGESGDGPTDETRESCPHRNISFAHDGCVGGC